MGLDDVREHLAAEASLLRGAVVGKIQQHRVKRIEIDLVGVPTGIEVTRLVLGRDEAAVQPDLATAGLGKQLDRFSETIEQTSAPLRPPEPLDHLVPRRDMHTGRQPTADWIELRKHATTLSLWICYDDVG